MVVFVPVMVILPKPGRPEVMKLGCMFASDKSLLFVFSILCSFIRVRKTFIANRKFVDVMS